MFGVCGPFRIVQVLQHITDGSPGGEDHIGLADTGRFKMRHSQRDAYGIIHSVFNAALNIHLPAETHVQAGSALTIYTSKFRFGSF